MKVDLSAKNPFSTYQSNFAANFSFGKAYDDWVCDTMLPALCNHGSDGIPRLIEKAKISCKILSKGFLLSA